MHRSFSVVFIPALLAITALDSRADLFVPIGLSPGDEYHLAFVTSGSHSNSSADISVYNQFVQSEAELNPTLTGTDEGVIWQAIASTSSVNARDNALVEAPVFLLDGTKIADSFTDMWDGSLDSPLSVNQFGDDPFRNVFVHTGSNIQGTAQAPLGSANVTVGSEGLNDFRLISNNAVLSGSGNLEPFYALSSKLVVAVPEESSFVLLTLSFSSMCLVLNRRRSVHEGPEKEST